MAKLTITPAGGGGGGAPSGSAGGDLGGTYPNPVLANATWDAMSGGVAPADCGMLAWTYPAWVGGSNPGGPATGTQDVWAYRLHVQRSVTATNVESQLGTAGATFTGNGAKIAIFSNDGATRLFVTADISGSLGTTGWKQMAFASPGTLAAGTYWIAFWCSASTVPRFFGASGAVPIMSVAANQITTRAATGQTDMPSTITISTAGNNTGPWFFGIT